MSFNFPQGVLFCFSHQKIKLVVLSLEHAAVLMVQEWSGRNWAHFPFFPLILCNIQRMKRWIFRREGIQPKIRLSLSRQMFPIPLVLLQENCSWTAPHGCWWHWQWSVKISSSPFSVVSYIHLMDLRQSAVMSTTVSLIFPRKFKDVWASDRVPT